MSTGIAQERLAARVRAMLDTGTGEVSGVPVREVAMFGGVAIMVDDKILVSAGKDGALLVRIDPARHAELTARPGASQAQMGAGRDMGRSWLRVSTDTVADDDELAFWVGVALEHNRAAAD